MGLLDSVKSALGMGGSDSDSGIMDTIKNMIGSEGGLQDLAGKFSAGGLGDVIGSWIGKGENLPVSPEQLQNVLGNETVSNLASKIGIDTSTLTGKLSSMLPNIIDKLTPDG